MAIPLLTLREGDEPPDENPHRRPIPRNSIWKWLLVVAATCGVMALLVVLGMPVGEAALAAPLLVGAATKVITDLQVTESATESGKAVSKPESVSNNPHFAKPAPDTDTNDRPAVSKPLPDQD